MRWDKVPPGPRRCRTCKSPFFSTHGFVNCDACLQAKRDERKRLTRPINDKKQDKPPVERKCLRCQKPFMSTWAGERVCSDCKQSSAWKDGAAPTVTASGVRIR